VAPLIPYRWELVLWLWLAFFLNQADRQIYAVVLPQLKADLQLTDLQSGLVASLFTAALAVTVPVAGYLGDVCNRKRLLIGSVFAWSLSTLLTALVRGIGQLIAVRSLATGVSEALYAPAANALISTHHVETRGTALAIHQTSLYAGVITSGMIAGWIADQFGWRYSFLSFGLAGIVLSGFLGARMRSSGSPRRLDRPPLQLLWKTVCGRPTIPLLAAGFASMVFVNVGYMTWMPTYLHERFGMNLASAGFTSMFFHHLLAFAGVLAAGHAADKLAPVSPRFRPLIQSAGLFLGAPFLWALGTASTEWTLFAVLAGFGFCRGVYDSGIYPSLFEVVEPRLHASMAGLMICAAFLAGAAAPVLLGAIKQAWGLSSGMSWLSAVYCLGGAAILTAVIRFFDNDRRSVKGD
jgi:MFS family permease